MGNFTAESLNSCHAVRLIDPVNKLTLETNAGRSCNQRGQEMKFNANGVWG